MGTIPEGEGPAPPLALTSAILWYYYGINPRSPPDELEGRANCMLLPQREKID